MTAAPGRSQDAAVRGDQGPHPGDRPLGAVRKGRLVVLHPHRGGPAVPDPLPAHGRADRHDDGRRAGAARRERRGRGPRVLRPRRVRASAPTTASLAYVAPTDGDEVSRLRFRDLETGDDLADEIPDVYYGVGLGGRQRHRLLHGARRRHAPVPAVAPPSRDADESTTCSSTRRTTSASSSASAAPRTSGSCVDDTSARRSPTRCGSSGRRPRGRRSGSSSPAARTSSTASSTTATASSSSPTTTAPRTSSSWRRPSTTPGRAQLGARSSPIAPT